MVDRLMERRAGVEPAYEELLVPYLNRSVTDALLVAL